LHVKSYREGDQTIEALFVGEAEAGEEEPVALPVVLEYELVTDASIPAFEVLAAATASAEDSATKA
jgi:hypothetical protein